MTGSNPAALASPIDWMPLVLPGPRRRDLDAAVLALLMMMLPTMVAIALDTRTFNGVDVWIKPLKFQASLALHLATVALFLRWLPPRFRSGAVGAALAWMLIIPAAFEAGYITLQAARGSASHFNVSTPVYETLYMLMGLGAVSLIAAAIVVGVLILWAGNARMNPPLRLAIGLGLILGGALGGVAGAWMSVNDGHWVGGVRSDTHGLPILGWSTSGGDLRVPHFFGLHMMQALPIIGWLARNRRDGRLLVVAAALAGIGVTVATLIQASRGQPFLVW